MEYLINEYIKKLEVNDIKEFAKKKNIKISDTDAIILYTYAKKYYQEFISGNPVNLINEIKEKINPITFKEIYKLYLEYKIKYLK